MKAENFYSQIQEIGAQAPFARHTQMARLHTRVVDEYMAAVEAITPERAAQTAEPGESGRSLAQVVAHIAAWEQFAILGAGDILAGVRRPRMVTSLAGFVDPSGAALEFESIDAFNAYQAGQFAAWPWERVQALALDTATTLHTLFTHPNLLTAERLEQTLPYRVRLQNGVLIPDIKMGWNLWITVLEHEAVDHARELGAA